MKKILLVFIVLGIVASGYAQQPQDLTGKINGVNQQIEGLKALIEKEHQAYSSQTQYTDKGYEEAVNTFNQEKKVLTDSIASIQADIKKLDKEYQWLEDLRKFYLQNMDTVFAHADLVSLDYHKKILGENYPKEMDELKILLDCSAILTKAYNETDVQIGLQKLKDFKPCKSKEYLENLLELHEEVTGDVNRWKNENDFSLFSMMLLYDDLFSKYRISLETDYPYLAGEVRKAVQQHLEALQNK